MREDDLLKAYGFKDKYRSTFQTNPWRKKCEVPGCITLIDQLVSERSICRFHLRSTIVDNSVVANRGET